MVCLNALANILKGKNSQNIVLANISSHTVLSNLSTIIIILIKCKHAQHSSDCSMQGCRINEKVMIIMFGLWRNLIAGCYG